MRVLLILGLIFIANLSLANKNPLKEGFLLLEKKEYERAFSTFSSIKNKEASVYTAMGMAKALSGSYERAIDFLFLAMEEKKEKEKWVPNYFLGLSFYNLKRYEEALPFLDRAYYLSRNDDILKLLAKTSFYAKDFLRAEELLKKIYEKEKDEESLLFLIKTLSSSNKLKEAESLANEGIKSNPKNPFILYERAKIRFTLGMIELAEKDIDNAIGLTNNPEIQGLYSSIKNMKKRSIKESSKKKTVYSINKTPFLYLLVVITLVPLFLIGFLKRKRDSLKEKLLFANTLLSKADYINAGNIFNELIRDKSLQEEALLGLIKVKIFLGKKEEASSLAEKIKREEDRLFYLALVDICFGEKEEYEKYLGLLEHSGYNDKVKILKKLSYSDKKEVFDFLIRGE